MNNRFVLYKNYIKRLLINPFTYFIACVYILFAVLQFFIGQKFFSDTGSTDLHHFFSVFPYIGILVIPALCALIPFRRRELSLPVSSLDLTVNKLFSLLSVLSVCTLLTVEVPLAVSHFGDVDLPLVFTGYLGIFLYLVSSISVCIFLYTLIESIGPSFIVSALVLSVINSSHLIAMYFKTGNFVSALSRKISFAWHFDSFGKGILDTRDIVFYLAETVLFCFLSVFCIEKKRDNRTSVFRKLSVLTLVAVCFVMADSSMLYRRIDVTRGKKFTISEYSKLLLDEVTDPMVITYYRSSSLRDLYPQVRDVSDFLEEYSASNSNIQYVYTDPSKDDVTDILLSYGIEARQIETAGRETTSYTTVYSAIVISYLGNVEVIPFVLDTSSLEYDITSHIQKLVRGKERIVQIVTANGLSLDSDYSYALSWLKSQGFTVINSYLPSQKDDESKSVSFTMLPQIPLLVFGSAYFTQEDAGALLTFIRNGGKVFLAMTPYSIDINSSWSVIEYPDNVSYILQSLGIFFREDSLTCDISNFRLTLESSETSSGDKASSKVEYRNYPLWPVLMPQTNALNGMTLFWPCAVDYDNDVASDADFSIDPYLVTSKAAWQSKKADGMYITNPFYVSQNSEDGDEIGQFALCVSLTKKGTASSDVFVIGDQYGFTNNMINYSSSYMLDARNLDFLSDCLLVLNGEKSILPLKNRGFINTSLYKIDLSDFIYEKRKTLSLCCLVPVILLAVVFAFVTIKRKNFNLRGL